MKSGVFGIKIGEFDLSIHAILWPNNRIEIDEITPEIALSEEDQDAIERKAREFFK